jgi:hypothetical protein
MSLFVTGELSAHGLSGRSTSLRDEYRKEDEGPDSSAATVLHTPEQIAERLGGMAVKSLSELIRKFNLETTTLHYAEPSRKGGRKRRVWGMTGSQLEALLALRRGNDRQPEQDQGDSREDA